jgi:integrase
VTIATNAQLVDRPRPLDLRKACRNSTALAAEKVGSVKWRHGSSSAPIWEDNELVFADAWGRPLDGRAVTKGPFRQLLQRAGAPRVRFHDMRHTYASLQLAAGTHPKLVQEVLGHSTIALTLDTHSHVTPTMDDEAAAATIERLLAPVGVL